jgi:methylated-DNA-[protein]-cysteine S-methyltransferase
MKSCVPDAIQSQSCRLGPYWVTVDCRGAEVAEVALGTKGSRDDRSLASDLEGVLRGGRIPEHLHVDATGLPAFTRKVLGRCAAIRPGEVMTYAGLAKAAGRPRAARAVGQVMANNPFALLIPCHRVVGSDRSLHGFGGGLDMKEWLLAREGWQFTGKGKSRRLAAQLPKTRKSRG